MAKLISLFEWTGKPKGHVIFVHGLGGDAYSTWTNSSGDFWPEWIAEEHAGVSVWTYSYAAPMLSWMGNALPIQDAAHTMMMVLNSEQRLNGEPIVFICHSLGGLMVKQMLREANDDRLSNPAADKLLSATKGVVFAATPHFGSLQANMLDKLRLIVWPSPATLALLKNDANLRNLNSWYRNWDRVLRKNAIAHEVFYETRGTAAGMIVDAGSADGGLPNNKPLAIPDRDHIDIVKPADRAELVHTVTSRFVDKLLKKTKTPGEHTKPAWPDAVKSKTNLLPLVPRLVILLLLGASVWFGYQKFIVDPGEIIAEVAEEAQGDRDYKHFELLAAIAAQKGVDPKNLKPLFDAVEVDVPVKNFDEAVRRAVDALLEKARDPVQPLNDGHAVIAAISAARDKLKTLDTAGAVADLDAAIASEEAARLAATSGQVRLLVEKAEILSKAYLWDEAVMAFQNAAALEPENAGHYIHVGDIHAHQGRLPKAMLTYYEAKDVATKSSNNRDLSVSLQRIGDVRARQDDPAGALFAYEASHEIMEILVTSDPTNKELLRDLTVSHNKVGDMRMKQNELAGALSAYEIALAIRQKLAASDPEDKEWQRDLFVSKGKIGDVLREQGNFAGALDFYGSVLRANEILAAADSENNQWQRDLSVIHNKIGDVRAAQKDVTGALIAYEAALSIRKQLAASDPSNSEWQRDLIVSHVKLAEIGHEPVAAYQRALDVAKELLESGRLAPADHWLLEELETRLEAAKSVN